MRNEYDFSQGKRGAVLPSPGKTRITIMLDNNVIEAFRKRAEEAGRGYQTLMNEALKAAVSDNSDPVTMQAIRRALREELRAA
jgi:uncharacterized protein (DUF4415 family)